MHKKINLIYYNVLYEYYGNKNTILLYVLQIDSNAISAQRLNVIKTTFAEFVRSTYL